MARMDQTNDWGRAYSPSLVEFESLAREAYARLPDAFRSLTGEVIIKLDDFPSEEIFEDMALETPFDLLGLFEGRGIGERFALETGDFPNRITLYRRAILDYWAEHEETLGDIITHVLIHEIGHHFGLSDDDMEQIEEAAE
ncbi:metallopeptidase family protein [Pararhizobium haloflavum]|uniref:metallopeptidase family protein n=1 Tax=Pararhizobium haloflavum TaxID=2037914 RepID=UPI000C181AF4|nr:metallopeptidase family protein [Pararhizobium haloflavum]